AAVAGGTARQLWRGADPSSRKRLGRAARRAACGRGRGCRHRARGGDRYRRPLRHPSDQQAGTRASFRPGRAPRGVRRNIARVRPDPDGCPSQRRGRGGRVRRRERRPGGLRRGRSDRLRTVRRRCRFLPLCRRSGPRQPRDPGRAGRACGHARALLLGRQPGLHPVRRRRPAGRPVRAPCLPDDRRRPRTMNTNSTETTPHGSKNDREIVDAKVIVTCPGRNFVTLKITTRSGVYGLGDATLNGRELAVASYLQDHVVPNLIGRDAGRIEDLWQFLYRGAYWRRGPVTMSAIAAVDVALWDILGKMAGLPVYQLLGGRSREGALVYGHANGRDIAEASDAVGRFIEQGFLAVRAQCGVPGIRKAYGISNAKGYEPAESELPLETTWNTPRYLDVVPKLFEQLRADHGPDVELLH